MALGWGSGLGLAGLWAGWGSGSLEDVLFPELFFSRWFLRQNPASDYYRTGVMVNFRI